MEEAADLRVVGEAGDGRTAIDLVKQLTPDVVVMDINMPDVDGIEATRQIVADFPDSRVLALSIHGDERLVEEMLAAGALGYLIKESAPEELLRGIRAVAHGEIYLSATIQDVVNSQYIRNLSGDDLPTTKTDKDSPNAAPILITKLHRPPLHANNVRRTPLLNQLEAGWDRPLALIAAPAGYGKSTLVSQWLASDDHPSAWLSLDESDNDLRTFLTYVVAAVDTVFQSLLTKTSALLQMATLPPIRILVGILSNELEQAPERFVLVLDDLHRISELAIHELLGEVIRYPSATLHLVLTTRMDPTIDLLQLRAYLRVNEIRAQALSFTVDETATFLEKTVGEPVDEATVKLLAEKTEGWPTGLHLATFASRDGPALYDLASELPGERQLLDYLMAEALSLQPSEIQTRLLKTSMLNRFRASLCSALFSDADEAEERRIGGKEFIRWLTDKNIFIVALDHRGHWFRYHHLFQELLQSALSQASTSAEIDALRLRAAHWFVDNDLLDEALEHALAGHDVAYAVDLVLQNRYALMRFDQWNRLDRLLSGLPAATVAQNPLLLSALAYLNVYRGQLGAALDCCEQATGLLATVALDETARETVQAELAVLQLSVSLVRREAGHAVANIQNALALIPTTAHYIHEFGTLFSAVALQASGRMEQALALIEGVQKAGGPGLDLDPAAAARGLCLLHALNGDLTNVHSSARRCLSQSDESASTQSYVFGRYFLSAVHYSRSELALAEPHLTALFADLYSVRPTYAAHGAIMLALLLTAQGRDEEADQIMQRLLDYTIEMQTVQTTATVQAFQVELALRQGKIAEALRLGAGADFDCYPLVWFIYVPQFTEVKLLLAQETPESLALAGVKLDVLESFLRTNHRKSLLIDLLALQALRHHAQGKRRVALVALTEALTLAERSGALRNFIDIGDPMADLISQMRDEPIDVGLLGFCEQVLAGFRSSIPVSHDLEQAEMVESLTERELQTLRLLATDLTTDEIAEQLVVSVGTVRTHTKNIYSKLDAHSRFEAVNRAQSLGII